MADAVARIAGRGDFQGAVRAALDAAAVEGWREIWFCDADFAHWPLGEGGVVDRLTQWAAAPRRLTLLALNYDDLARRHPRFVAWRRQWAHVVDCRVLQELQANDVPVLLHASERFTLQLLDPLRFQGRASRLAADGTQARELIDAVSQRSVEAFPPTTLGL